MIAVSSRRLEGPSEIIDAQIKALESWRGHFPEIYFPQVIEGEKPSISYLTDFCASLPDWSCLLNADIIIGPNWSRAERALRESGAVCAISRRYEIPKDGDLTKAEVVDQGLDFFAATPTIWASAAAEVPEVFRLGKILWDTWMLGFFMHISRGKCADLTPARVVFHPQHGDRRDQNVDPPIMRYPPRWPTLKIGEGWPKVFPKAEFRPGGGGEGGLRV